MSWERMKSFLIVLFVAINIFLIGFMLNSVSKTATVTKAVVEDTVSILHNNNIRIDIDTVPLSVKNTGFFEVTPINVSNNHTAKKTITDKNAKGEIKKALKNLGIKDYIISRNNDGSYYVGQKVYGYYLYDSGISAVINGNTLTLEGKWYIPKAKPSGKDTDIIPVTSVLIEFMNNPHRDVNIHNNITDIAIGYCVPGHDNGSEYISMTAVPCYCITTSNGASFLYEASNGAFSRIK